MTNPIADPLELIEAYVGQRALVRRQGPTLHARRTAPARRGPRRRTPGRARPIDLVTVEYADRRRWHPRSTSSRWRSIAEPQDHLCHALIGMWDDEDFGPSHVYDAVHDRYAMAHWLKCFAETSRRGPLRFHRLPGHEFDLEAHSTLFSGEQSNSSVRFGEDSLIEGLPQDHARHNPDIAVHKVLTLAGSEHVAELYGWVEADSTLEGEVLQLAMLQQFLRTASDGWDLALTSVRNLFAEADLHADEVGGDFAGESGPARRRPGRDPRRPPGALPHPPVVHRADHLAGRRHAPPARRRARRRTRARPSTPIGCA